jgi:asparagine synthase (glutamine-hydrolysing)
MCGIAGIVDFGGIDAAEMAPRLNRAVARLARRGPDGTGTWHDDTCALAHTRLAIIDLSEAAAQPMEGHGGVIVFNGEIYNFALLAGELRRLGHRFVSRSDTEVLLAGWRAWGVGLLDRLVGMFAFALWSPEARELVLARDRFGKKPLVYHHQEGQLSFGSDLVALSHLTGTTPGIDPTALRLLFALRYIPEPWTIHAGFHKLPAGHVAVFNRKGVYVRRWYSLAKARPPRYRDEAEAAAVLRQRVDAAVADRLVADVPVGAFLSGGIDSAIIAASLAAQGKPVRTFTVGFPGASAYYEERPAALRVARHLGLDHTEIEVGAAETGRVLDDVLDGFDEPFADSSAIPTCLLARETRRQVTVALSGDGADEVFGGYRKHLAELHAERYRRLPGWLRRRLIAPLVGLLPEGKDQRWRERARQLRRFVAHADGDPASRQAGWIRDLAENELDALFAPAVAEAETGVESLVAVLREDAADEDPINAMLAADIALVLAGDMLVKVDRMTMHHALEVRCPYLDQRVVECAAAMPGSFKLANGTGKRILRLAFADRLPAEVFARPKKGFEVPIARWLTGDLVELTRRAIDPERLRRQGLFRPELPQQWFEDLRTGRRDTAWSLWTMVVFQAWADRQSGAVAIA